MKRIILSALALGAIAIPVAGCGANDASVQSRDHGPANVINFPNGFSSVSFKCDGHGHMVYEQDHSGDNGGANLMVVADQNCGPGSQ